MRHSVHGRKLSRTSAHRKALFRNQLASLIQSEKIRTTLAKAKELRPVAEKMITRGKQDTVHARRLVAEWVPNRTHVKKLFDEIAPRFANRPGGYTRTMKLGSRAGDAAPVSIIELVDRVAAD